MSECRHGIWVDEHPCDECHDEHMATERELADIRRALLSKMPPRADTRSMSTLDLTAKTMGYVQEWVTEAMRLRTGLLELDRAVRLAESPGDLHDTVRAYIAELLKTPVAP